MKVRAFLQSDEDHPSTLSELLRVYQWAAADEFFGLYAYATQSGAVAFDLKFGANFWNEVPTRWLFGIDYGRTQPQALRFMIGRPNTTVRIHDGAWVVEKDGFLPRRDFHMKASFLSNETTSRYGMVVGSGNFSSNGLRKSVECGATLRAESAAEFTRTCQTTFETAVGLWDEATPAEDILDEYEERWNASGPRAAGDDQEAPPDYDEIETFWIEAGYVTRNRGPDRPG